MTKRKTIAILAHGLKVPTANLHTSCGKVGMSGEPLEVPADEAEKYIADGIAVRAPEEQLQLPDDTETDDDASESD